MRKISLSWNSRTPENIVTNDENFANISEFINKGKGDKWILNFYGYDNKESKAFIEKLQKMLMESIDDKNFLWKKEEIHFYCQDPQFHPHNVLQKLKRIPMHRSGVVILYEPIYYSYVISEHLNDKLDIHQELAEIFGKRNLLLLLFGNIPYDIHYFRGNSPLSKFLWREFEIKEYGKDELNVLCHLKENVGKNIIECSEGNFELAHGLETFWEEIEVEGRVTDLVNNFLEVPLRTKIEKLVYEKLAALSHFLENNKDKIKKKIDYVNVGIIRIKREKDSKLFKAYFDKNGLFDCKEVTVQTHPFYELAPKYEFENLIQESGFIENKGKIEIPPEINETDSKERLIELSHFIENNKDKIKEKIDYVNGGIIRIRREKGSKLFKAYFDKTALFDCKEITVQIQPFYELTPKDVFENTIRESGFIENKGKVESPPEISETYSKDFSQIAAYFETKKPMFILGAGNSLKSGAPDRKKLFKDILTQIYSDDEEKFEKMPYEELKENFQNTIKAHPQDDIRKRVIKLLSDLKPSIGHFHLMQLMKSEKIKIKVFITTNFDTLLEDSLMDYGIRSKDFIKLVSKENIDAHEWDLVNEFPNHLKIFKICGDMYYGSWLAVDDEAANNWIESAVEAMANVEDFRTSHFLIILGHKFEEIDLSKIFEKKKKQNMTIVYANPDETDCREFEKRYKHKCKSLKIIHGDFGKFDNFMEELSGRLRKRNLV